MRTMRKNLVLLIISVVFLLAGCNDGHEINERNFVLSFGIDKGIEEKFEVSLGIATPQPSEQDTVGEEMKMGNGGTLVKAMNENESNYSRNMYYGHTKTIIIGDELLKEEDALKEIVDTLMRSNDFSLKTIILCAQGSAKECIESVQTEGSGNGLYIWDYYKNNAAYVENTTRLTLKDLELAVKAKDSLVIPLIKVEGERPVIGGGIMVDGEKMIGTLSSEDMTYYSLTINNCEGYLLHAKLDDEEIPIFVKESSCDIKANGDKIIFKVYVKGDVKGQGSLGLVDDIEIEKVEESLKKELEEKIKETITMIKNMGLSELEGKEISVEVKAKIRGTGVIR